MEKSKISIFEGSYYAKNVHHRGEGSYRDNLVFRTGFKENNDGVSLFCGAADRG